LAIVGCEIGRYTVVLNVKSSEAAFEIDITGLACNETRRWSLPGASPYTRPTSKPPHHPLLRIHPIASPFSSSSLLSQTLRCLGDTIPASVTSIGLPSPQANINITLQTTIFSPEGRLYQVEYALEAISHAGTALGILAQDGIVLAAERKVTSKLLEQDTSAEKLYILNE